LVFLPPHDSVATPSRKRSANSEHQSPLESNLLTIHDSAFGALGPPDDPWPSPQTAQRVGRGAELITLCMERIVLPSSVAGMNATRMVPL